MALPVGKVVRDGGCWDDDSTGGVLVLTSRFWRSWWGWPLANGRSDQFAGLGWGFQMCSARCCGWLEGIDFECCGLQVDSSDTMEIGFSLYFSIE